MDAARVGKLGEEVAVVKKLQGWRSCRGGEAPRVRKLVKPRN